jgi:metallo-beta-lactamase family protein
MIALIDSIGIRTRIHQPSAPMGDAPTVQFLGASGTVTGSKHLVTAGRKKVLLDCGLFQGLKELRLRNWQKPPFEAAEIASIVLSHAHIDHSGYLPILVRTGFRGPIYCTSGTADLLQTLLCDAAHLQEEEAETANRYGYSKHTPALPLFTVADAEAALALVRTRHYQAAFTPAEGLSVVFRRAGHILGSATIDVTIGSVDPLHLVFSGDLGRWGRPILRDPDPVSEADVLLVESTYGDRLHSPDPANELARIVIESAKRGGALIVPAFAIGRTQELIWTLRRLEDEERIPRLPVYLDGPMAIDVTAIYCRHPEDHDLDMKVLMDEKRCPLCCAQYHMVRTVAESKALNDIRGPVVIIAGSGMISGGRVLHHLKLRISDHRTTVLLAGYQAAGTRGRALQEGACQVRIHGRPIPVRAKIETLDGLSAHADREEIFRWLRGFAKAPRRTYVVHGEPHAAASLAERIRNEFRWETHVPSMGETALLA